MIRARKYPLTFLLVRDEYYSVEPTVERVYVVSDHAVDIFLAVTDRLALEFDIAPPPPASGR